MTHTPDSWVIVKIAGTDPHYRVFGGWRGGFDTGDNWRMNSGIVSSSFSSDIYSFKGFSGSEYLCHKTSYGKLSAYCQSVLDNIVKKGDNTIEVLQDRDDWTSVDWILARKKNEENSN